MPESYDKNVSVFTFRKIIGAVNETRIRDARFSIFPPVLLPANVEPAFIFWHVEADVRRDNKICEVRVRFNTSARWLPREENFYGRRRRLSHESRRLREQRRVRVVPRAPVLQNEGSPVWPVRDGVCVRGFTPNRVPQTFQIWVVQRAREFVADRFVLLF